LDLETIAAADDDGGQTTEQGLYSIGMHHSWTAELSVRIPQMNGQYPADRSQPTAMNYYTIEGPGTRQTVVCDMCRKQVKQRE